jgi:hypothetical protein
MPSLDPQTTINTLFWLLKDQSSRYNELAVTCAQNPCIEKKKEKRTTTIADLEILHPNPTLPKNQNKASFLSFFFFIQSKNKWGKIFLLLFFSTPKT